MIVIPAIDLRGGKCVRLLHGEFSKETVYSDNPVDMARRWIDLGATRLHVIDLDGARSGQPQNFEWVLKIKKETGIFIQVGGGIRTLETVEKFINEGIDRVILGTVVFEEAGLAQTAFEKYSDRIMVAMDVKHGFVAVRGWENSSGIPAKEALKIVEKLGGKEIIFTDVSRDGTLEGANLVATKEMMDSTSLKIYASGGVTSMKDIQRLIEIRSPGCIVGKAIYENKLDLWQAIQLAQKS